jgi:transcription elongation factor Elf1
MADDDLRHKKEMDAESALAESIALEKQEPTKLGCLNCGSQLYKSPTLSKHYGCDVGVCNMCGAHISEGKMLNNT